MSERARADAIRSLHAHDAAARRLGIEVSAVEAASVEASLHVGPEHLNARGLCHGGVLFTLADTALQYASNADGPTELALAADVFFLRPVDLNTRLVARCEERARSGSSRFWEVPVREASGELVALFRGQTRRPRS